MGCVPGMKWEAFGEEVKLTCITARTQTELFTQISLVVAQMEHEDWFFSVGNIDYDPFSEPDEPFTAELFRHRG